MSEENKTTDNIVFDNESSQLEALQKRNETLSIIKNNVEQITKGQITLSLTKSESFLVDSGLTLLMKEIINQANSFDLKAIDGAMSNCIELYKLKEFISIKERLSNGKPE